MKYFIFSLIVLNTSVFANIGPQEFKKWVNPYFVETGTYNGAGIQKALKNGFRQVHSIEINKKYFKKASKVYNKNENVHLHLGDSGEILGQVIENIDEPITFWLDGHRGTPDPEGGKNTPLLEELEQIKYHPYKGHTIIIDDLHCCGKVLFDNITLDIIIRKIWEINPEYKFIFEDGGDMGEYKNNILIAYVETDA